MKKNSIPKPLVWAVVVICVLPTLFTLTGVDLGSAGEALARISNLIQTSRPSGGLERLYS